MHLFEKTGKMALATRLRMLTARMTDDGYRIFDLYHVQLTPKWFPVFFVLSENEEKTITEIANEIGHSQPSVTTIVKEMAQVGLVESNLKSKDKRRNLVKLTPKGLSLVEKARMVFLDVDAAVEDMLSEATHNLWEAIAEWEFLLERKPLLKRMEEQKKTRESKDVRIVRYKPKYRSAFKSLNEEWISNYFELEEIDRQVLGHPEQHVLEKGGEILIALYENEPVGTCALIKHHDSSYDFELSKMAVSPQAQGKKIGYLLGQEIIKRAKELGASKIYLEGNTLLEASINLYHKLGFRKIAGKPSHYKRVNIQMELLIDKG